MSNFGFRYVVDNNALAQLSPRQRSSAYFRKHAEIPTAVLSEASRLHDISQLSKNEYPISASVLRQLKRVMETLNTTDTRLVDLYAAQGTADPLLIACALDGQEKDDRYLDGATWVIVTGDKAVRAKAEEFGLQVISNAEFAETINDAKTTDKIGK